MNNTGKKQHSRDSVMSLGDHIEELRLRLILISAGLTVAVIICLFFGKVIIAFIEKPYVLAMGKNAQLQSLAPVDGFTTYMQVSMISGVVISSPWIFYHLWMYISAGLYKHEKRYVYLATPFSAMLFTVGALFFMFAIAPITLRFLVIFNKKVLGIESNFTFQNYISFTTMMMLVFGLAFQTPVAIFFLNKAGLVSVQALCKSRKFVLLGIVIAAAVITPGSDIFSLASLAVPLYLLFELGILLSCLVSRKKTNPV
jgi:sec-independent protein translocase protein TatC